MHFVISDEVKQEEERKRREELELKAHEPSSWLGKLVFWFKTSKVTPFVKLKDPADPFGDRRNDPDDIDAGCDGKTGVCAGIKIRF
jgi:hypothetical protein